MPNKTLVPDKLQGYLLQVKHMLYELISLDDRIVSIEKLDDVAIEVDRTVIAEQIKSVTSANNPISERSPVFWKTLYNWCTYIEDGSLPHNAVLRFVIVANRNIKSGGIQDIFLNAHDDKDAQKALKVARATILGAARADPSIDVYMSLPDSYRDYVKYLFDDTRAKTVCGVIKSMEIDIHSESYEINLLERFGKQTIPEEYCDTLLTYMLGWVTKKVESFTKNNKPAYITAKEYRNELNAQIKACNVNSILRAVSTLPTNEEIDGEVRKLDTYIKQLKMIEADETELFEAASDFLRTKIEKTEWARRGIVIEQSFDDYHDTLYRIWNHQKQLLLLQPLTDAIIIGKALYSHCSRDSITLRLQGVETPSFFGTGSLQGLANDPADSPMIGWHPQYKVLLKGSGNE